MFPIQVLYIAIVKPNIVYRKIGWIFTVVGLQLSEREGSNDDLEKLSIRE